MRLTRRRTDGRARHALSLLVACLAVALLTSNLRAQTSSPPVSGDSVAAPRTRHGPVAYLTPDFSIGPGSDRGVYVLRGRLEVPLHTGVRPWLGGGIWGIPGPDCFDYCSADSGAQVDAGFDALSGPNSSPMQLYVGAGLGWRSHDGGRSILAPIGRLGLDVQPWPWVAPRAALEVTRYPVGGWRVLLSAGIRLGVPGGFAGATPP